MLTFDDIKVGDIVRRRLDLQEKDHLTGVVVELLGKEALVRSFAPVWGEPFVLMFPDLWEVVGHVEGYEG